jgi:sigma-B regulation protein RsbU (phosphoserine phosphatase)
VLQWYRDGDTTALVKAFGGKLVLVGVTAVGEVAADVGPTPFSEATPLVYIHANAVNAALAGRFLSRPSPWVMALVLVLCGLVLGVVVSRLTLGISAAVAGGAVLAVAGLDWALFRWADLDVPPTAALLLPPLVWIGVQGLLRRRSERQAREREKELNVARSIQRHLLPAGPPDVAEVEVFGENLPAEAVGGDYYDWLPVGEDELAIVVGDVSGHGVPAALLMSHLRASLHAEARAGRAPREIVQSIHNSLARAAQPGKFATFFLVLISRREPRLRFCSAGHNPVILVRAGENELLGATGLPLAMLESATYTDEERPFAAGDTLVLYSDGIPEAPVGRDFYGDERLQAKVGEFVRSGRSVPEIGQALLADVQSLAGENLAADDVTLVVVRRK